MSHREQALNTFLARARKERLVMGVLNTTPDSFSDGGQYIDPVSALARAEAMNQEGADIIDVGGESTRPGAVPVPEAEERTRTIDVIQALSERLEIPISIDTYKAGTAKAAAKAGAILINDISGMRADPDMARTVAETQSALVITYNRGKANKTLNITIDMPAFFHEALEIAARAGIPPTHILLDPGVGFAKTYKQNFQVLAQLGTLAQFNCPILVGTSRKSFIGKLTGREASGRLAGTLASHMAALQAGAHVLRVHDVAPHRDMIDMLNAIGAAK